MKTHFTVNVIISAAIHALIIVLALIFSYHSWRVRRPPREITTFIEFQTIPEIDGTISAPAPEPVVSKPVEAKPKTIEVSRRIVRRDEPPPRQAMTPEEIRKRLGAGERRDLPDPRADAFSEYLSYVRFIMHNAWMQPPTLSGASGLIVGARIRVRRDGQIVRREIIRGSGNEVMDASVMGALESVDRLRPLPPGRGEYENITIDFELTLP